MFVNITIPFTKSIFDILDTNPEDIKGLSQREFAKLQKQYVKNLKEQWLIEAHNWCDNNLKHEFIIGWAEDTGSEDITFEILLD